MTEYVEREAAIEAAKHAWAKGLEPSQYMEIIPAANVAPVVHGRWIMHDDEFGLTCECSACHIETMGDGNYCPNCGAKMDGELNEQTNSLY